MTADREQPQGARSQRTQQRPSDRQLRHCTAGHCHGGHVVSSGASQQAIRAPGGSAASAPYLLGPSRHGGQ